MYIYKITPSLLVSVIYVLHQEAELMSLLLNLSWATNVPTKEMQKFHYEVVSSDIKVR